MAELEYRIKTTSMPNISRWRELKLEEADPNLWDYQHSTVKVEYFEIRVKPTFEPGYFQCTGTLVVTAYRTNDVVWMASQGEIDRTDCTWVRVNVTPAD